MTHPSSPPAPMTAEILNEILTRVDMFTGPNASNALQQHIDALTARVAELERNARFTDEAVIAACEMLNDEHAESVAEMAVELRNLRVELAAVRKVDDKEVSEFIDWLRLEQNEPGISAGLAGRYERTQQLLSALSAALKEARFALVQILPEGFDPPAKDLPRELSQAHARVAAAFDEAIRALQTKDTTP